MPPVTSNRNTMQSGTAAHKHWETQPYMDQYGLAPAISLHRSELTHCGSGAYPGEKGSYSLTLQRLLATKNLFKSSRSHASIATSPYKDLVRMGLQIVRSNGVCFLTMIYIPPVMQTKMHFLQLEIRPRKYLSVQKLAKQQQQKSIWGYNCRSSASIPLHLSSFCLILQWHEWYTCKRKAQEWEKKRKKSSRSRYQAQCVTILTGKYRVDVALSLKWQGGFDCA